MIRVCSDWNLLYRCLSVDILLYDALLFQFLGISYGYYSTLCRMRSCCFQGSGPDSQHSAPCSTGNPDINSSTTIFAEFVYVALMLLLKAAHHASRQRAIPYLCLSLDFLKPFSREESCFLVTVNKLTSSFATLLLQNVFAYDDSKGLFCEALFLLKLLLFCGYFQVPSLSHANESSLYSQLPITSHVVSIVQWRVCCVSGGWSYQVVCVW